MTSWRPPASQARRDELAIAYAKDGYALLQAVYHSAAPGWLRELPAVDVLRRVLLQNYTRTVTRNGREVIRRSHWPASGRAFFRATGGHHGDHRNWPAIDAWTDLIASKLHVKSSV